MSSKSIALAVLGLVSTILSSEPTFASKLSLSDQSMASISGGDNGYTTNGTTNTTNSQASSANANIQFGIFQWTDSHVGDHSQNNNANNQSGSDSQVQQNVGGSANALVVGAVSQNVLANNAPITGGQSSMAYAVIARGGN